jgi:hypothetical protein
MAVGLLGRNPLGRREADHHVGMDPLRSDEVPRVRLALFELGEDLLRSVAALGRVAPDLPDPAEILRGIQVHLHVKALPHPGCRKTQETLGDDEFPGHDVLGPGEGPV